MVSRKLIFIQFSKIKTKVCIFKKHHVNIFKLKELADRNYFSQKKCFFSKTNHNKLQGYFKICF